MRNLLIIGAGGHGKVVAEAALLSRKWEQIAFLDDNKTGDILGVPVVGRISELSSFREEYDYGFVALGDNEKRLLLMKKLIIYDYKIPTIIHPSCIVSIFSDIGEGTVILSGSIIGTDTKIGRGCIINTASSIDHDCTIGDGVHISPGVHIAGGVTIGAKSIIYTGASIINQIMIGTNSVVGAGAVVIHDLPSDVTAIGIPAIIKRNGRVVNGSR